ncbi:hypothetical protein B0187_00320 [Haemophilus paracuniculus]|uniref:Outer membrane antigenic lipoprotein B n=1 Tax=Haemophilus paracuniculus TaxID=734 RepID=A0A1T0AV10_9PAST|nr:hypothetical protein [Haemophilus paracuniculus]OOS00780.1 hypothetical protein B0187_00320 [Haemophilus paracuniculus]
MKKTFFSLAIFSLFLTACNSQPASKAEVRSSDPNELPPGVMQPVAGSGATEGSYSWPSDIQTAPMPASMAK